MISDIIARIKDDLSNALDENQMELLTNVLKKHLTTIDVKQTDSKEENIDMLALFMAAKRVEGCSDKSLRYYESTIRNMLNGIGKSEFKITTEDLRKYLDMKYLSKNGIKNLDGRNFNRTRIREIVTNPLYLRADASIYEFFRGQGTRLSSTRGMY